MTDPTGEDGVAAARWAQSQVGSTDYQLMDTNAQVRGTTRGLILGGISAPKCNIFVSDALAAGGDPVTSVNGENRAPVASEWGDRSSDIGGYTAMPAGSQPQAGDIVSDGHHVGISVPIQNPDGTTSNATVSAATPGYGNRVVHNDWGFRPGQTPVIWRADVDVEGPPLPAPVDVDAAPPVVPIDEGLDR